MTLRLKLSRRELGGAFFRICHIGWYAMCHSSAVDSKTALLTSPFGDAVIHQVDNWDGHVTCASLFHLAPFILQEKRVLSFE